MFTPPLHSGILIAIGTGLIWTFVGVIMSHCSRAKLEFLDYFAASSLFTGLLTMLVYVRWDVVTSGAIMNPAPLLISIIGAALVNGVGLITMQLAMKQGHNGLIWAIGQSALVVPFLCGIVIHGEKGNPGQFTGVGLILLGMLLPSLLNEHRRKGQAGGRTWPILTFTAFLLFGLGQSLQSLPSFWAGWRDNANIRPSLSSIGSLASVMIFSACRGRMPRPDRKTLTLALGMAALNTLSIKLFYVSLDKLSASGMASLGFPLIVGACIVGFFAYSLLILRETSRWFNWFGLTATLAGIFLISV
jgi:drug/metabolite transporter (DMT)-like permease